MFKCAAIDKITTTMKKTPLSSSSTLAICSETKLIAINILWPNRFSQRRKISGGSRLRRFKFFACKRFGRNLNFKLIFLTILKHSWLKRFFFWSILSLKLSPIYSSFLSIVNFTVCCPFYETVANTVHSLFMFHAVNSHKIRNKNYCRLNWNKKSQKLAWNPLKLFWIL